MYKVTRLFTAGILKGLTYTGITAVNFELGFICNESVFGSPYKIVNVEEIL